MVENTQHNSNQSASKRVPPQLGTSAENSPALRQVRVNFGGANVPNTLRQSNGKLGSN